MARTKVVNLGIESAVKFLEKQTVEKVFCQKGVWNSFEPDTRLNAIERVKRSSYGADIYKDNDSGDLYVSMPTQSDMW